MIDFRPVGYIVGWLVLGLGLLMMLPIALDLADRRRRTPAPSRCRRCSSTLIGAAVALACADGWRADLSLPQGFMLTTASWLALAVMSTCRLMLGAPGLSFTDALFETTSAMTTTGGTVIAGLDELPRGALLWRGLVNWVGGIGVVLLAMILLPVLNVGGMQMLQDRRLQHPRQDHAARQGDRALLRPASTWCSRSAARSATSGAGCRGSTPWCTRCGTVATGGMGNYDSSFVQLQPGGAVGRHRLHAARRHVVRPLRASSPAASPGALLARQPDPRLPR